MFWTTDDAYLTEISNAYPEHREEWKECYETERKKDTDLILVFADLFYRDEGAQKNVTDCLKEDRKGMLEKVDEIIKLYIDFYKPKLVVVTNADASDYIYESQYCKRRVRKAEKEMTLNYNANDIKFLFSVAIHGSWSNTKKYTEALHELKQRINDLI